MLFLEEQKEQNQDSQIVTILGRFDSTRQSALDSAIEKAESLSLRHIILNLEKVDLIDSHGVSHILFAYDRLKDKGISLSVMNPKPDILELLNLTGISRLVPIFNVDK